MAGNDSSYPGDIAIGTAIAETRKIKCGMYALIEDPAGPIRRQVIRSVEDLVARMPGPRRGQGSRPTQGVPVVRVIRTIYDAGDRPVEVQGSILAPDRHEFCY